MTWKPARPHKFGAKRTVVDGVAFPSKKEARRWSELLLLERAGKISQLTRQNSYDLVVNGMSVGRYVADFGYLEAGVRVTEDSKGMLTPVYRLKKKLMLAIHGIEILET